MNKEKIVANLAIWYFVIGLIFAISFAIYYKWTAFSYFSPGFYMVLLTWPIQLPGIFFDFQQFGWAGKVLS